MLVYYFKLALACAGRGPLRAAKTYQPAIEVKYQISLELVFPGTCFVLLTCTNSTSPCWERTVSYHCIDTDMLYIKHPNQKTERCSFPGTCYVLVINIPISTSLCWERNANGSLKNDVKDYHVQQWTCSSPVPALCHSLAAIALARAGREWISCHHHTND